MRARGRGGAGGERDERGGEFIIMACVLACYLRF